MEPVKVLQLGSPSGLYGAERWILALVRHLDPAVVESRVAVIRDDACLDPPLIGEARHSGLMTHIIEAPGRVNWSAVKQLREYILREDIAIVHSHGYKTDIAAWLATRGTSCKRVTTPHGWSVDAGWKLAIYEAIDRLVFHGFDAVAPLSQELYSELSGRGLNLYLIANGVDIAEIDAADTVAQPLADWRTRGDFIVGYVGQMIARKGLPTLLRAFAQWAYSAKRLVLVGDGPQRADLELMADNLGIGNRVHFAGFRDDRLDYLRGFDVFVLPSQLEGIPRCLMEAMAANVAVIASDIPGCRDIVVPGNTGLLFAAGDANALVGCLNAALDSATRQSWTAAARANVHGRHSGQAMAVQYAALYRSLVEVRAR